MSERVVGDPVVLTAYTDRTLSTLDPVGDAVQAAEVARKAFERAQDAALATGYDCMTAFEPHAPEVRMTQVLELLEVLDRTPAAFAFALRQLDVGKRWTGSLDPAARPLSATDDEVFQRLLATHVSVHIEASRQAGSSATLTSSDIAALLLASAEQVAARDQQHLDQLVKAVTERAAPGHGRVAPVGTWQRVRGGSSVLGLVLVGTSDLQRTADDELATFGERTASVATAVATEGLGAAVGTVAGGAAGSSIPIPIVGTAIGAAVGSYVGGRIGQSIRESGELDGFEDTLARHIDELAGTEREPDRYDDLLERGTGDG